MSKATQAAVQVATRFSVGYCAEATIRCIEGVRRAPRRETRINKDQSESITGLLKDWQAGDEQALDNLMPVVYEELTRLARRELGRERAGHSLDPTDLVHDAYRRIVNLELPWRDRAHFYCMAARTMRRVLVDHARARTAKKRGGGAVKVTLSDVQERTAQSTSDVLDLAGALDRLQELDARLAQAVELYYFGGMSYREIGHALKVSPATVDRDLRFARAWLSRELASEQDGAPDAI